MGGYPHDDRITLHIFEGGTVTSQWYCTDINQVIFVFLIVQLVKNFCLWVTMPEHLDQMKCPYFMG